MQEELQDVTNSSKGLVSSEQKSARHCLLPSSTQGDPQSHTLEVHCVGSDPDSILTSCGTWSQLTQLLYFPGC